MCASSSQNATCSSVLFWRLLLSDMDVELKGVRKLACPYFVQVTRFPTIDIFTQNQLSRKQQLQRTSNPSVSLFSLRIGRHNGLGPKRRNVYRIDKYVVPKRSNFYKNSSKSSFVEIKCWMKMSSWQQSENSTNSNHSFHSRQMSRTCTPALQS